MTTMLTASLIFCLMNLSNGSSIYFLIQAGPLVAHCLELVYSIFPMMLGWLVLNEWP
jgi:hypothetical protein